mmetsp:Transcript_6428/g.11203  ORF Transcript_6428/g.11203 Transcript_6428/m.11203 type:complete len:247 (-) Transcript_6428:1088-1828(-)
MGCTESRVLTRPEESSLIRGEEMLGFWRNKSVDIDQVIRKYSANDYVNDNHLLTICKELQLPLTDPGVSPLIPPALNCIRKPEGLNLKQFLVLGILAGEGEVQQKAQLLFEVYDDDYMKELNNRQIQSLLTDLLLVVVTCLGALSSEQVVQAYVSVIQKGLHNYRETLKEALKLPNPCPKFNFIQCWFQSQYPLLSPYSIRQLLYQESQKSSTQLLKKSGLAKLRSMKSSNAEPSNDAQIVKEHKS